MYHSRMLRAAKEIGNVNEFVYLAKEISRMLKEEVGVTHIGQIRSDQIRSDQIVSGPI